MLMSRLQTSFPVCSYLAIPIVNLKKRIVVVQAHGPEVYLEVRSAYIETMSRVLSAHFRTYIAALARLQTDIATKNDLVEYLLKHNDAIISFFYHNYYVILQQIVSRSDSSLRF